MRVGWWWLAALQAAGCGSAEAKCNAYCADFGAFYQACSAQLEVDGLQMNTCYDDVSAVIDDNGTQHPDLKRPCEDAAEAEQDCLEENDRLRDVLAGSAFREWRSECKDDSDPLEQAIQAKDCAAFEALIRGE